MMLQQQNNNNNGDDNHDDVSPLKPLGRGHAIAHFSSNRHSGAATVSGVRDILVIFLAATTTTTKEEEQLASDTTNGNNINLNKRKAPRWEYNARIKSTARTYCSKCCGDSDESSMEDQLICRIFHHRLAIDQVPNDGEAWHYLGMALLDYHNYLQQQQRVADAIQSENNSGHVLEIAVSCLEEATKHTPCDGRLCNNLGIALERLLEYKVASETSSSQTATLMEQLHDRIRSSYQNSIMIHSTCERIGCDVAADYESACLNYGLYLSYQDDFGGAIDVLSRIVHSDDGDTSAADVGNNENGDLDAAAW
eukprot:CAMPEP_0183716888 /NCGR_PEP_ID=MMETSP0737-20130205/10640_1 /TAXON_ID=385413 /ORGANISM="Thalassiosira miniscula, Strain CCMP1093" /LENGTH=308 /DNA_ID=CAMNT_0025946215 /DNA_START=170 /DNA_END=1093 /DNA_ORIENTATION=+